MLDLKVTKEGEVTAGITEDSQYEVVNKDQVICTLDRETTFECEMEVRVGRGFASGKITIGRICQSALFLSILFSLQSLG